MKSGRILRNSQRNRPNKNLLPIPLQLRNNRKRQPHNQKINNNIRTRIDVNEDQIINTLARDFLIPVTLDWDTC
jgi:hypothetical protein